MKTITVRVQLPTWKSGNGIGWKRDPVTNQWIEDGLITSPALVNAGDVMRAIPGKTYTFSIDEATDIDELMSAQGLVESPDLVLDPTETPEAQNYIWRLQLKNAGTGQTGKFVIRRTDENGQEVV